MILNHDLVAGATLQLDDVELTVVEIGTVKQGDAKPQQVVTLQFRRGPAKPETSPVFPKPE